MQILLGAKETLIKIDEHENIQHIIKFISNKFASKVLLHSQILIPYANDDHHKRLFLLKWFYSIYCRGLPEAIPALKDSLINRVEKPIRVMVSLSKKEKVFSIQLKDINDERLRIEISPSNLHLLFDIQKMFNGQIIATQYTPLCITVKTDTKEAKLLIKEFIKRTEVSNYSIKMIYDKNTLEKLFKPKPRNNDLQDAYAILNIDQNLSIKNIKKHYLSLAKQYHPDTIEQSDQCQINFYTQKFQMISNAFDTIKKDRYENKVI